MNYYNENDKQLVEWLHNLIDADLIAPGIIDDRSIEDVRPTDLGGFTQCHFFAGIGVWSYALRRAGWSDERPVWTGSCPCQPFSAAGKGAGFADERHLWPAWFHLIRECRPPIVFGEQVASKDGLAWLDLVHADLEGAGYAIGAADLCAAGVGAPHIRQRIYFVGESTGSRRQRFRFEPAHDKPVQANTSPTDTLAHDSSTRLERCNERTLGYERPAVERGGGARPLADDNSHRCGEAPRKELHDAPHHAEPCGIAGVLAESVRGRAAPKAASARGAEHSALRGFWHRADWITCRDGKARPVEPGTFPLAHGAPARVVRLRAYGNAIVAPLAAEFILAYLDATCDDGLDR